MNQPKRNPAEARKDERGVVIIYTAFFLLFMLGFVALGIDAAKLAATKTQLQNAADAAALAGASAVDFTTGTLMADTSVFRAQQTAALNKAFVNAPTSITLSAGDVSFPAPHQVRVKVRREAGGDGAMVTHVAQVLGITSLDMSAAATAEVSPATEQCERLVPFGAIPPNGQTVFQTGCQNVYTLVNGQGGGQQGNWLTLDFPKCYEGGCADLPETGDNTLRCLISSGYSCCVSVNQVIQTEPGANTGPIRQGLQYRYDSDTDTRPGICYSEYTGNRSRIINVPIIEPLAQGRTTTRVLGFTAFFLKYRPSGGAGVPVLGEFLYDVVPGSSSGAPVPSTSYVIHLVQ